MRGWLERLSSSSRQSRFSNFSVFMDWLRGQSGWADVAPEGLLEFQEKAVGRERYALLNLIQKHVKEVGGTRFGMQSRYSAIRSFFLHNRVELPKDNWDPGAGTREPTRGKLTVDSIRRIIQAATLRDRAILLTLFQGLIDQERFCHFNVKQGGALVRHLKTCGVEKPFRIDFMKGRKRNHKPFFTFIGRDALEAWLEYFEKERGWPGPGEPLAVSSRGGKRPLSKQGLRLAFDTLCRRYKLKQRSPKGGDTSYRSGVNLHEFRDVARSHLQTAKRDGLDEKTVEFMMGHLVDPLNYLKFAELQPDYVEENYKIVEKYLNIISTPPDSEVAREQAERVSVLEKELAEMKRRMDSLQATVTGTIQQLESRG